MDVVLFGHFRLIYTCVYTGLWGKMHCLLRALVRVLKNTFLAAIEFGISYILLLGFPCGSAGKESICNTGDLGSIPGLGRSPGEGKGYPLQYSGLENSMNYTIHGILQARILEWEPPEYWSLSLLQGIFPNQESNPGLLHCRRILYQLSHKGSPEILG